MLLKKSTSQVCQQPSKIGYVVLRVGYVRAEGIDQIIVAYIYIYIITYSLYPFVLLDPGDNHFVSLGDSVFFSLRHASLRRRFSTTEKSHIRFQEIRKRFEEREIDALVVKKLDDLFRVIRSFEKIVRLRDIESPIQY